MGVDFLSTSMPTFERGWDSAKGQLAAPNLFSAEPDAKPRTYLVQPREGESFTASEQLYLKLDGTAVVAIRGRATVGDVVSPALALIEQLNATGGYACCVVIKVHPRSGNADVTLG